MNKLFCFIVAIAILLPVCAHAEEKTECGVGIAVGEMRVIGNFAPSKAEQNILNTSNVVSSRQVRNTATTEEISFGCKFNKYIGLSASYLPAVEFMINTDLNFTAPPVVVLGSPIQIPSTHARMTRAVSVSASGLFVDLFFPTTERLTLTASLGVYQYSATRTLGVSFPSSLGEITVSQKDTERGNVFAGIVGAKFRVLPNINLFVKYAPAKNVRVTYLGVEAIF